MCRIRPASAIRSPRGETTKAKPQPKWGVLRAMNVVVATVFIGTVGYVIVNYQNLVNRQAESLSPITNFFFPVMVVWTFCLAYFFGFFGISFIDTEEMGGMISKSSSSTELSSSNEGAKGKLPSAEPRNDTAICSDKPVPTKGKAEATASKGASGPKADYNAMRDDEVLDALISGSLKDYQLEKVLSDMERAVCLRRMLYENILRKKMDLIPYQHYDYNKVFGANCEIVLGYVPLPLGCAGPLVLNGEPSYVPMATTEGCLVASTNRGCKAISASGGCHAILLKDAITRAPCLRFPSAMRAAALKRWVEVADNYYRVEEAFNSTTNYGRLDSVEATVAGRNVFLRFCCMAGDAMGMNMVSKGCLKAIEVLEEEFPDMTLVAISGNMCTDKKPAAINWLMGRGKSVVCEAVIPEHIVTGVLKSSVYDMIETNKQKNHIGSAMAGSIGGFNAHAANIVTAVFLATGQDPAQNVESSNCITIMEYAEDGKSLHVSVTMPSIEVGTVGGGTHLPAQAGCLEICGVRGAAKGPDSLPGDNARQLALLVAGSVLAGELSLMAALAANHLVRSHMEHNRKPTSGPAGGAPAKGAAETGTGAAEANMKASKSMSNIAEPRS